MIIISFQRKHALRAYSQALQIYKGKNWSLAEVILVLDTYHTVDSSMRV